MAKRTYSNYSGYLLKIGDYKIPAKKYIAADTYKASAYMQDIDDYTDANGYLHREAVELKALKVEFETPAMLTDEEFAELMHNIDANIIDKNSNACNITAFVPRYNKYYTQRGYMVDVEPQIYGSYGNELHYDPIRIAFIGGVYDG